MNPRPAHRRTLLLWLVVATGTAGCNSDSDSKSFSQAVRKVQAGQSDTIDVRDFPKITDEDLVALEHLEGLRHLTLDCAPIGDSGLGHLAGLRSLRSLSVSKTNITDAGLIHLRELTDLEFLRLDEDRLTDGGLACLEGLTRLRELSLWKVFLTDKGLVHLQGLVSLESLSLDETQVTTAGVKSLVSRLPKLKRLKVWKTKVPTGALAELTWTRSELKIEH
jgi:hypothetical protein